ncbi:Phosphatidylinositol transfer protein [Brugia malayi]|uniref:Bm9074, isoform b n=1 Tax=Brugia malayi TaxID=6279 RepID=A0A0J9Y6U4_BRUMA|nr:Phosphatidylinositol transfer protein [Brugia malayi]CDQ03564.2 Bm9074, isoform b [Brugia malayi]VIO99365.1 Phosphatidylinositol transfer protein [Brugia malayi]
MIIKVLENDGFTSTTVRPGHSITGIYTHKIYRTKSKSPWALRKIFPDAAFVLHEECWNAFPYCKTVIKALDLSPALLKKREVIIIDIYDDSLLKKSDITPETDVREFESKKTGRGRLPKDWIETTKPVMCCYKVVQVHFKMFGFQTMVEHVLQRQYPRIFAKFNRELYCWTDRWYDMTIEDIKKMEREATEQLKKQIAEPEKRGTVCDVDDKGTT